jgi:hypothetical protein
LLTEQPFRTHGPGRCWGVAGGQWTPHRCGSVSCRRCYPT